MSDNIKSKCPYCGSGLLQEEDGYRCRFCKSFFPFETEEAMDQVKTASLYKLNQQAPERPDPVEAEKQAEEEKVFAKRKAIDEMIGILTSFASAAMMLLTKILHMPLLMIPGFILWAFAAGYTGYRMYQAKKSGRKAAYIRVAIFLVLAILILLTVRID